MPPRDLAGPLTALVLVQVSFASLLVAGEYVLDQGLPPLALAALRVLFASLLLALIMFATEIESVRGRDLAALAGLALLGVVLNQFFFLEGLARTTAINASVLIATIPVFTLCVAILLRHEYFDAKRAAGILIAFAGTLILLRVESFTLSDDVVLGNLLIVLNCLVYSFYLVLARSLLARYRSSTVVAWTFLLGAALLVPAGVPDLTATPTVVFTPWVAATLVWIILVPSVLAYSLNNYALKRLHASTVGSFVFLQPVIGVLLSLALLPDESLSLRTALGGLVILAGVLLVSRTEARPRGTRNGGVINREGLAALHGRAQPQPQEDDPRGSRQEAP